MATQTAAVLEDKDPKSASASEQSPIIVVDVGRKQRRKQIRKLRKGRGRLHEKVQDMIDEFRENGALAAKGSKHPTVVVVVREKERRRMGWML